MSEVEDGKPLSEVVKAAKNLGFTEPGLYVFFFLCMQILFLTSEICGFYVCIHRKMYRST